jgi:hypothetical protein
VVAVLTRGRAAARGRKALVLAAALGAALGVAELALRLASPLQLGFEYVDGRFVRPREFEPDSRRNRLGFHDLDPGPRARVARRVVLLGDSYVEGLSVAVEDTVGQQLARALVAAAGRDCDVVALGRAGWGQREQLDELRRLGPALAPDAVVTLFLSLNDVRNNSPELQRAALAQSEALPFFRPGWSNLAGEEAPGLWLEGSRINQLVSHRLARLRTDSGVPLDYFVYARRTDPRWERAWRATEALLRETRRFAGALGARYAIVSASTPQGVHGAGEGLAILRRSYAELRPEHFDLDGPDARLGRFCATERIPFLRLEPLFRERWREHGERLHWRYDGHWNARGHALAGRRIAEFVMPLLGRSTQLRSPASDQPRA